VRAGYVILATFLNAFAACQNPVVGNPPDRPKIKIPRQHLTITLLQLVSILIVIIAPYCDRRCIAIVGDGDAVRSLGLAMYCSGFLAMHFSQRYLGKQFSLEVSLQQDHALITDGPYRYLRHPRYLGIIVFSSGISLVFRSWIGFAAALAAIPVLLWRIRDEESLLRQEFGQAWEAYCSRSWRLVPFVY
jgi:protein-S-isoprenylcysteine O-methyltransferase Ste14